MVKGTIEQQIAVARYTVDQEIDNLLNYEKDKKSKQLQTLQDRKSAEYSAIDVLVAQFKKELNDALGDNLFNVLNLEFSRPSTVCFLDVVASFEYRQRQVVLSVKDDFCWVISGFGEDVVCKYDNLKQDLIKFLAVIKSSASASDSSLMIEAEKPALDSSGTATGIPTSEPSAVAETSPTSDTDVVVSPAA